VLFRSGTSEFEIELLKEKNYTLSSLNNMKNQILLVKYLDEGKVLDYYNQIDMIIFAIDKEYEEVRKRGNTGPLYP